MENEQENNSEEQKRLPSNSAGQSALSSYVLDIFEAFKTARLPWEEIWEECWYNFIGQYQPKLNWKPKTEGAKNRSRIFIKLSTLKCNTAHSKITDVLFGNGVNLPFETKAFGTENLNISADEIKEIVRQSDEKLKSHLKYINIHDAYDTSILEMAILGTAVLKGPIVETRKKQIAVPRMISGVPASEVAPDVNPYVIKTQSEIVPVIDPISLWEYYVDINAKSTEDSIGEIHFQRLLPANFRKLAYQGGYIKGNVLEAARRATAYDSNDKRYIQIADNYMGQQSTKDNRVSTLEYWGLVPVEMLADAGVELPEDADREDSIEALVVLGADGIVIKACVNPLGRRPFYVCPYKKRPHVIYGMGVAEAMRDSQKMINSAARMIIDNKALSGNGMVGINLDRIDTKRMNNDFTVYSGKTWYIKGNFSPKDAVDSVTFPDITEGLRELMEMFERFSDEETGIPKYTNGEQDNFLNKMLDVNTPVPMWNGTFKKLLNIVDGDKIIGRDGKVTTVVKAHPVSFPKTAYELVFRSGEKILAGGEHLWAIRTVSAQPYGKDAGIINTDTLFERMRKTKVHFYVPRVKKPLFGVKSDLPLDPYILGLWLGDGHSYGSRFTTDDPFIVSKLEEWAKANDCSVTVDNTQNAGKATTYYVGKKHGVRGDDGQYKENGSLVSTLKKMGLIGNKHIPEEYLRAPYEDRLSLLRGLMDTDGCHHSGSLVIFSQKEGEVKSGAMRLISGLGGFPKATHVDAGKLARDGMLYWNINFCINDNPFLTPRKADKWEAPKTSVEYQRIVSITPVDICEMRCLTVDAEDGLYCVGERFTVTHNTASGMSMLMTQANINLKTVIKNIDMFWTEPIVKAFNDWFMEFGDSQTQRLPLKIIATGSDSLIAKELRMENLMKFMQVTQGKEDAIFMDRVKLMKEIANILETRDVMRTDEEIKQIMDTMNKLGSEGKDWREIVDIDRLFPFLARSEQAQILTMMGIKPSNDQGELTELAARNNGSPTTVPVSEAQPVGGVQQ